MRLGIEIVRVKEFDEEVDGVNGKEYTLKIVLDDVEFKVKVSIINDGDEIIIEGA